MYLLHATAATLNKRLYLIGGVHDDAEDDAVYLRTTFAYDPATNIWSKKADMNVRRGKAVAGKVKNGAGVLQVVVTGGNTSDFKNVTSCTRRD